MSTHEVPVIRMALEPHPNADNLGLQRIGDNVVACRISDFTDCPLGAWIAPDYVVNGSVPEFSFLGPGDHKIKVQKIRKVPSFGMIIKARPGWEEGDNVIEELGIRRWEPNPELTTGGMGAPPPALKTFAPVMDVENLRNFPDLLDLGDKLVPMVVTEKIHGASGRWVYSNGEMHVGSRRQWWKEDDKNIWWKAFRMYPELETICRYNHGVIVYGEVYGKVQDLNYGKNGVDLAVFDMFNSTLGQWIPWDIIRTKMSGYDVPLVPELYHGKALTNESLYALAEGPSLIKGANHWREGIVAKFLWEPEFHWKYGRRHAKVVSKWYLSR